MGRNIRIAKELVRIAKSLVGANVSISIDFTEDEAKLKAWCDENGYGFSSDGGTMDKTFCVKTTNGDIDVCSDLVDMKIKYDIYFDDDELNVEGLSSIEDVIKSLEENIEFPISSSVKNFEQECTSRLSGICSDICYEAYAYDRPVVTGIFNRNPNLQFLFGYYVGKWGYEFNRIDDNGFYQDTTVNDYSYDTPEKAIDALVKAAKQAK